MHHAAMMGIATIVLGLPLIWLKSGGLFGSKDAYGFAFEELSQHGRVVLSPPVMSRMIGLGPLIITSNELILNQERNRVVYAWSEIPKPFTLHLSTRTSKIMLYHFQRNVNFGKRKLFRNSTDEFIPMKQTITSAYMIGWDNLLNLLNEGRVRGYVAEKLSDPSAPHDPLKVVR